jgi:hypothetical protein
MLIQGKISSFTFILLLGFFTNKMVHAQPDPFYQGKQIRIIVGASAGGFYDRWARLLARFIPKYLPGNPSMIVQTMPGAGSLVATNYVYSVSKPDGLTLLMPNSNTYLEQLSGHKEVRFDLRKFAVIGSQEKNFMLLYMRADAPYKTIGDIINAKEPPNVAPPGCRVQAMSLTEFLSLLSAPRSTPSWAIRAVTKLIWPWRKARFNAAATPSTLTTAGSRSTAGTRRGSTAIWYRPQKNATFWSPKRRRFTN